jgi:general secretion pathway protein L
MAEIFVVRLSDSGEPEWVIVDSAGMVAGPVGRCPVEKLPELVGQRKLVVLAPSHKVLLTSVKLPIRNPARLRQALPFALEEQVAEDLAGLHCAAGRRRSDGDVPAAIVRRQDLEEWLGELRQVGLEPAGVYGEQDAMPGSPTATVWLIENESCLVHRPGEQPIAIEGRSIDEFLLLGDPRQEADESSAHLTVYLGPDDENRYSVGLDALRTQLGSVDVQLLQDGALPHLASRAVREPGINLLQGEYAPRTGMEKLWRPWRVAAILLIALIAVSIGRDVAELVRLSKMNSELDAAMDTVFRQAMPDVQRIVNHRRQMESRLAAVRASRGVSDAPFLKSLEALGRAIGTAPGTTVESLSFRNGVMEVKLSAPSVDTLDAIQRSIEGSPALDASILSANPRGDAVEGRIQLTEAGA